MGEERDEGGTVSVVVLDSVHVITATGRFDIVNLHLLSDTVARYINVAHALVVDLAGAVSIDAAVARALRSAQSTCTSRGRPFTVAAATGQTLEVLEVLGTAKKLGAYLNRAAAIDKVREAADDPTVANSLSTTVHDLLSEAHALDETDPRRRRLQVEAIEVALPLARTIARRYQRRGEPSEDLFQVASLGVVRTVYAYDPTLGSGFLAFAVPSILGEIRRHFRDRAWTVRPPRRLQELRQAIQVARPELNQSLRREPTATELAAALQSTVRDVNAALMSSSGLRPASLDAPVVVDGEQSLGDTVGSADPGFEQVENHASLLRLIAKLPDQTRQILALRFNDELTQAQIAERVGTSQMHISRVLKSTLDRLRHGLTENI